MLKEANKLTHELQDDIEQQTNTILNMSQENKDLTTQVVELQKAAEKSEKVIDNL